jgi:hypothetical protein
MANELKYLVTIGSDYTATLYTGKGYKDAKKVGTIELNHSLPLNHGEQRDLIENLLTANHIIPLTTELTKHENADVLHGKCIIPSKFNKEAGVSLLEVSVGLALTAAASALALGSLQPLVDNIHGNIDTLQQQAASQQAQLDALNAGH